MARNPTEYELEQRLKQAAAQQAQPQVNPVMLLLECARTCYPSAAIDIRRAIACQFRDFKPEAQAALRAEIATEAVLRAQALLAAVGITININKPGG